MLRRRGFDGGITLVSADAGPPLRPAQLLQGLSGRRGQARVGAAAENGWYQDNDIDLKLKAEVTALDLGQRTAALKDGGTLAFDALILALGAEPNRPPIAGFDQPNVFVLRTLKDADAIVEAGRSSPAAWSLWARASSASKSPLL